MRPGPARFRRVHGAIARLAGLALALGLAALAPRPALADDCPNGPDRACLTALIEADLAQVTGFAAMPARNFAAHALMDLALAEGDQARIPDIARSQANSTTGFLASQVALARAGHIDLLLDRDAFGGSTDMFLNRLRALATFDTVNAEDAHAAILAATSGPDPLPEYTARLRALALAAWGLPHEAEALRALGGIGPDLRALDMAIVMGEARLAGDRLGSLPGLQALRHGLRAGVLAHLTDPGADRLAIVTPLMLQAFRDRPETEGGLDLALVDFAARTQRLGGDPQLVVDLLHQALQVLPGDGTDDLLRQFIVHVALLAGATEVAQAAAAAGSSATCTMNAARLIAASLPPQDALAALRALPDPGHRIAGLSMMVSLHHRRP